MKTIDVCPNFMDSGMVKYLLIINRPLILKHNFQWKLIIMAIHFPQIPILDLM